MQALDKPELVPQGAGEKYVTLKLVLLIELRRSVSRTRTEQKEKGEKVNRKSRREMKNKVRLDPRYASARPWDWRVCNDCQELVPVGCPKCGSDRLSGRPRDIVRVGLRRFGPPPGFFQV